MYKFKQDFALCLRTFSRKPASTNNIVNSQTAEMFNVAFCVLYRCGYPDPIYLKRIKHELQAKVFQ